MNEFIPQKKDSSLPSNNQTNTTVVITDVPSDIAYKCLIDGIANGRFASREEIQQTIDLALELELDEINPEKEHVEMRNNIPTKMERHTLEWQKVEGESVITEVCRCKDCGAIIAHRVRNQGTEQLYVDYEKVSPIFNYDETVSRAMEEHQHENLDYGGEVSQKTEVENQFYDYTPTPPEEGNTSGRHR